jgi:8-oxo-dGTP pyrophosphatase MutT (NUDIX family)
MSLLVPPPKLKKWTLSRPHAPADYRVFRVHRNLVVDGEGKPRRDVFTFECPDWCNVVAVTSDDHVVFVWQYRFGTEAMSLEIPGGVVDDGEAPIESARRELLEETGFAADALEPLSVVEPNPALQGNRCHTFLARGARRVAAPSLDENEELEELLVPVRDLSRLLDEGHVTHALVHSALEAFLRKAARG